MLEQQRKGTILASKPDAKGNGVSDTPFVIITSAL